MPEHLKWKVHTHDLFNEIVTGNKGNDVFKEPLNITLSILRQVAVRATELNDKELNKLMIRLTLYAISDPHDPQYNPKLVEKYLDE